MGYVYQVIATIVDWLNLAEGQHLALEAGEDIDLVRREATNHPAEVDRTVQLVHKPARALTLKSRKAVQAIANFCGHRKSNPGTAHRFRFLTTARAGIEQGWPVASRLVYRF